MTVDAWADTRYVAKLQEMYYRKSAPTMRAMREELNVEFRTTFSRNAVIGKCKRLGLDKRGISQERQASVDVSKPRDRSGRVRIPAKPKGAGGQFRPSSVSTEIVNLRCVEVNPRLMTFLELQPNDCRFIYGNGDPSDFRFCGHPKFNYVRNGIDVQSSYCGPHYGICQGQGTASERAATKVRDAVA
jgi:GcrA cell cycle regulator